MFGFVIENHHTKGVIVRILSVEDETEVTSSPLHPREVLQGGVQPVGRKERERKGGKMSKVA